MDALSSYGLEILCNEAVKKEELDVNDADQDQIMSESIVETEDRGRFDMDMSLPTTSATMATTADPPETNAADDTPTDDTADANPDNVEYAEQSHEEIKIEEEESTPSNYLNEHSIPMDEEANVEMDDNEDKPNDSELDLDSQYAAPLYPPEQSNITSPSPPSPSDDDDKDTTIDTPLEILDANDKTKQDASIPDEDNLFENQKYETSNENNIQSEADTTTTPIDQAPLDTADSPSKENNGDDNIIQTHDEIQRPTNGKENQNHPSSIKDNNEYEESRKVARKLARARSAKRGSRRNSDPNKIESTDENNSDDTTANLNDKDSAAMRRSKRRRTLVNEKETETNPDTATTTITNPLPSPKRGRGRPRLSRNTNANETEPENSPKTQKRKYPTRRGNGSDNDNSGNEEVDRNRSSSHGYVDEGTYQSEEKYAGIRTNNANGVCKFGSLEESIMIRSALDERQRLVNGPGKWMLHAPEIDRYLIDNVKDAQVAEHWDNMLSQGENYCNIKNTPLLCRARHVQSICYVNESPEARKVALLSAGWNPVINASRTLWSRPTTTSRKKHADPMVLEKAWREHIHDLYSGVRTHISLEVKRIKRANASAIGKKRPGPKPKQNAGVVDEQPVRKNLMLSTMKYTTSESESIEIPRTAVVMMKARANFCAGGDPRPCITCSWCGPRFEITIDGVKNHNKLGKEAPNCKGCTILYKEGWQLHFKPINGPTKDEYQYTNGKITCRSVKSFLTETTKHVARVITGKDVAEEEEEVQLINVPNNPKKRVGRPPKRPLGRPPINLERRKRRLDESSSQSISINLPTIDRTPLPKIEQLVTQGGLQKTIISDKFHLLNTFHGSTSEIVFKILSTLTSGEIPDAAKEEIPFLIPQEDDITYRNRFFGVTPIPKLDSNGDILLANQTYGVEIPQFTLSYSVTKRLAASDVQEEEESDDKTVSIELPRAIHRSCKKVLLRTDIESDEVAGKLYAFVFRILFGTEAVNTALEKYGAKNQEDDTKQISLDETNS